MSDYEIRGGDENWRMEPGFSSEPPGPVWNGHGQPPAWTANASGCGCASCEANTSKRHHGEDDGEHHAPGYSNPYEILRLLNASPHDPATAREQARQEYAAEHAGDAPMDGQAAGRMLARRSFDGSNLSGSEALARLTEFRAI